MSTNGHGDDHGDLGFPRHGAEEDRRMKFKNAGKTKEELRRRRVEDNVELRKAKREDTLMKRRNVDLDHLVSSPESPERETVFSSHAKSAQEEIENCRSGMSSTDETKVFNSLQRLRKLLSREVNPPIDEVLESGLMCLLVELMKHHDDKMKFEAAWAVTNIASGTSAHTTAVIKAGSVPILLQLVAHSNNTEVAEQALWCLGNIVGDGAANRDAILQAGITPIILAHLEKPDLPRSFVKNIAWMISNLARGKDPAPNFDIVGKFLPALSNLVESKDMDTVVDAAWSLSYLSDGSEDQIEEVIASGVVPKIVRILISTRDMRALTPCVRTIGNIVTGNDAQTDVAIQSGALNACVALLDLPKPTLVKEVCWLVSNVAAGNVNQIQAVLDSGCMDKILAIMRHGEYRCQKEAAWVATNVFAGGNGKQMLAVVEMNVIPPLCEMLKSTETRFVAVLLDALANLLESARKNGYLDGVVVAIEECGGLDSLENLQNHDHEEIYRKSFSLIETYFGELEDDENVPEVNANGEGEGANQFNF